MIWSLLKSVASFILPGSDSCDDNDEFNSENEEKNILNDIKNFRNLNTDHLEINCYEDLLGHSNSGGSNVKTDNYLCRTGTITFLCNYYGLIDEKFYFDLDCISPNLVVNKNDKVSYVTTESSSDDPGTILKICSLSNECWDPFSTTQNSNINCNWSTEFKAVQKVLNGKVIQLNGRKFLIEPHNIWCNMDKLEISYEPIEGDWVSFEASVSVDDKIQNWEGDVLEVASVKPLLSQNGTGRVTFWVEEKNEGVINNTIVFDRSVCVDMYMPTLGDLVSYEAVESDQGKFKWRGIWVKPDKMKLRESKDKKIFKNKKGIVVTQSLSVIDLKFEETKEITLDVLNRGKLDRVLVRTKMCQQGNAESQLSLKSPDLTDNYTLKPGEKLKFVVTVTGKYLGSTGEMLEFQFDKFRIAKSFEINVIPDDCVEEFSRLDLGRQTREKRVFKRIGVPIEGHTVFYGSKPYTNSRFYKGPPKENFDVPKTLWGLMVGPTDIPKSTVDAVACLRKTLPYLACGLSPVNYVKRFHTLLHLEEIAIKIRFTAYSISDGKLEEKDGYWFIEVSGLAEGRPSILQGDKVIVTKPWMHKITHIGFVHKLECNGVYVDFHSAFSHGKLEQNCDVKFMPNIGNLVKCHQAIGKCFTTLGKDWFFPSRVIEKPDRISFEVADESVTGNQSNGVEKEKKTLVWNNKNLNERQKMAVVNVLRGRARPMPYIVFGPPGTGKTTTLVEIIIQTSTWMPDSRILVCGPSNSSVDLVTERLIDSGLYKLGELIRLYAVSRLQNIPEKLMPYMDCVGVRNETFEPNETGRKIKGARITLGTFSSIGGLRGLASFENYSFTHILIDEAAQMTEPETMIPVCFFAKENSQLVLAGDPKQLGPVCTSLVAARFDFEMSFLERLMTGYPYKADRKTFPKTSGFDPRLVTKLTLNHRSLPEIIDLPNQLFYDSDLVPLLSDEDSYEANLLKRINIKVPKRDKHPAIIFHGVVGKNLQTADSPSWYNPQEIWQLVVYLKKIYESGLTADDVGIVTPYIKQVQKCRSVLASVNLSVPQIGTVNNFQGQEKHVIILSTVRSCIEVLKKDVLFSLGFVASPRRLNVALTRARSLLIILGNPNLLRVDPYWEKVIMYCMKNKSYVGCNIKQILQCNDSNDQDEEDSDSQEDDSKNE